MPVNLSSFISTIKSGTGEVTALGEGSIWEHVGWDNRSNCSSSTYDKNLTFFCVPTGFCCARFEIWGGGGGGGPARCCAIGIPGNAGAYARKCITVTAGSCYQICTGACSNWYEGTSTRGTNGPPGCAAGTGLTNFYANGGCGGLEWCMAHANACYVGNVVWNRESNVTGNIVCTTWGPGADVGCYGLPGFIERVVAGSGADDFCSFRHATPYPAFKYGSTGKGGWQKTRVANGQAGYADSEYDRASSGLYCVGSGPAWCFNMIGWSGIASPGAAAKGGNCCYGGSYSPTRIKITYKV